MDWLDSVKVYFEPGEKAEVDLEGSEEGLVRSRAHLSAKQKEQKVQTGKADSNLVKFHFQTVSLKGEPIEGVRIRCATPNLDHPEYEKVVTTDANGKAEYHVGEANLGASPFSSTYWFSIDDDDRYIGGHTVGLFAQGQGPEQKVLLAEPREFSVSVKDRRGNPIPGAEILVTNSFPKKPGEPYLRAATSTLTDEKGVANFLFAETLASIVVNATGFASYGESPILLDTSKPVEIELTKGRPIRGRLTHPNGEPAPGIRLMALRVSDPPDIGHRTILHATTEPDGSFLFAKGFPGVYRIDEDLKNMKSPFFVEEKVVEVPGYSGADEVQLVGSKGATLSGKKVGGGTDKAKIWVVNAHIREDGFPKDTIRGETFSDGGFRVFVPAGHVGELRIDGPFLDSLEVGLTNPPSEISADAAGWVHFKELEEGFAYDGIELRF